MSTHDTTDLLIVGGGVLGTFHARAALRRGLSVRLCERHIAPRGATVRNFGQVVPSGMVPKWQAYGRRSLEIYQELQAETDITVRREGTIYLASDEDELGLLEELAYINRDQDYPSRLLTAAECLRRYPGLRADYCRGGLYFPEEVTIEADTMIHRVLAQLVERGLRYHAHTTVVDVDCGGARVQALTNNGKRYFAQSVVVCSGGEFQLLYPQRFAASDLELCKLQMLRTVPVAGVPHVPGNVLTGLSIRRYEAFRQCPSWLDVKAREPSDTPWKRWGVHILFKQCPDGGFIIGDSHEYAAAAAADELDFALRPAITDYILAEARRIFDLSDWRLSRSWAGYYAQCARQDIFHESIDENIHVVTGIGGKGMTASPGYAEAHIASLC